MTFVARAATATFALSRQPLVHRPCVAAMPTPHLLGLGPTSTQLGSVAKAAAGLVFKDYSGVAVNYFTSIRVPASLVAGSSLAAMFSLKDKAAGGKALENPNPAERVAIFLFHMQALVAFLLSLNTVLTATATLGGLLVAGHQTLTASAYELLTVNYKYEFLLTRWSFFTSVISFLSCITTKALIEFQLLTPKRIRSALVVSLSVSSLILHILSLINTHLKCWPNFGSMTMQVFRLYIIKGLSAGSGVLEVASVLCFFISLVVAGSLFVRAARGPSTKSTDPQ